MVQCYHGYVPTHKGLTTRTTRPRVAVDVEVRPRRARPAVAAADPAAAQTWTPNGPVSLFGTSIVVREAGLTYVCKMTGSGSVTGGTFRINTLSLSGGGLCGAATFFATPYTVVGNIGGIIITGVQFSGIVGFCSGNGRHLSAGHRSNHLHEQLE